MMKLSNAVEITRAMIEHNLSNQGGSNSSFLVPMWWSLPGEGKTTAIENLVAEMGGHCSTVIAAQFDAGELGGFPFRSGETMVRARPFFMPTEEEAQQYSFICLNLDELVQAPKANQNVIAQLVNERRIGEHRLPNNVVMVAAGNPLIAQAGTNPMPSHLKDRMTHLHITTDHEGFREYALEKGFLPEITSFINERPEWLQKFDPKVDASPSPRSWERANSILKMNLSREAETFALQGQLGEGTTADFTGYLRIWRDLPKSDDVLKNPKGHAIPTDPSILYALCSSLAHKANKTNIKSIIEFGSRFENQEFTAFLMKDTLKRHPDLKSEKVVTDWFFKDGKTLMM